MSERKTFNSKTTILGSLNNLEALLPISSKEEKETTLNYHYNIFPNEPKPADLKLRYFGVGIQGTYLLNDEGVNAPLFPKQTDMNFYTPLPLRCVPFNEDLTPSERAQYRMRYVFEKNGQQYVAYYLKPIIFPSGVKITRVNAATLIEEPYELDSANLSPVPTKPSVDDTTGSLGNRDEINVSVAMDLSISGKEILEAVNVMYDGDILKGAVSEYGLFTGADKLVSTLDSDGVNFQYTEAIYTQMFLKQCCVKATFESPSTIVDKQLILSGGEIITK